MRTKKTPKVEAPPVMPVALPATVQPPKWIHLLLALVVGFLAGLVLPATQIVQNTGVATVSAVNELSDDQKGELVALAKLAIIKAIDIATEDRNPPSFKDTPCNIPNLTSLSTTNLSPNADQQK